MERCVVVGQVSAVREAAATTDHAKNTGFSGGNGRVRLEQCAAVHNAEGLLVHRGGFELAQSAARRAAPSRSTPCGRAGPAQAMLGLGVLRDEQHTTQNRVQQHERPAPAA